MGKPRYDVEISRVEQGTDERHLWQTQKQALMLLVSLKNGDDLVVHRTDSDAEDGVSYP